MTDVLTAADADVDGPPPSLRAGRLRRRGVPWGSVALIVGFLLVSLLAPVLSPHDPFTPNIADRLQGPSAEHLLGTDALGRDLLSRVMHGGRITLVVVGVGIVAGAGLGLLLGVLAGYIRGPLDVVISRLGESTLAMPGIFFGLLFAVTMGGGLASVSLAVTIMLWARFAQVIRTEVVSVRERDFIALARVAGVSHLRIIGVHVLPSVMSTFSVLVAVNIGYVVLLEASLSFLGAGIPPPNPSWGSIIADGQQYITSAWWIALFPGLAILLTVLAFNILGDWVRIRLNPRLRD